MTFVNKNEIKSQNKLIKNYLDYQKLLKQMIQRENFAKQQLQQSASEHFRLINKTFQKTQTKPIKSQIKCYKTLKNSLLILN